MKQFSFSNVWVRFGALLIASVLFAYLFPALGALAVTGATFALGQVVTQQADAKVATTNKWQQIANYVSSLMESYTFWSSRNGNGQERVSGTLRAHKGTDGSIGSGLNAPCAIKGYDSVQHFLLALPELLRANGIELRFTVMRFNPTIGRNVPQVIRLAGLQKDGKMGYTTETVAVGVARNAMATERLNLEIPRANASASIGSFDQFNSLSGNANAMAQTQAPTFDVGSIEI